MQASKVNVWSIAAGDAPSTARVVSLQQLRPAGGAAEANVERDGGDRRRASSPYSVPLSPALSDPADNLAYATSWTADGALWEEENVLESIGREVSRCVRTPQTAIGGHHYRGWRLRVGYTSSATVRLFHGSISTVPAGANGRAHQQETGDQQEAPVDH
jgi:hypothetical protein